MKKLLLLLAVAFAFTLTAVAQDASQTGGTSDQTTTKTTTKSKKSKKSSDQNAAAADQGAKPKKERTLTGCISAQPDANGNYTLSNGRYKKGVEVGPADKLKDHAGHQVELKGEWAAAAAGATNASATEKPARHFEAASVKHLSDTCSEAPGGGTTGATHKAEKKAKKGKADTSSSATPPPSL